MGEGSAVGDDVDGRGVTGSEVVGARVGGNVTGLSDKPGVGGGV